MPEIRYPLLQEILSQPTAPFREGHVIETITHALKDAGVPFFSDPVGNIIVGRKSKPEYVRSLRKSGGEPVRIYIAHMDHPGFHGVTWENGQSKRVLKIKWHGGSPTQDLLGAKVWLANKKGWLGEGKILHAEMTPSGRAIASASVEISEEIFEKNPHASTLYGGFGFRSPVWREGDLLYTKAADDLIGCFAIVSLAIDLWTKRPKGSKAEFPFIGLLTRAEEVGFIGAIGHFELGWLKASKRPILAISLETSRTLPGAEIGKGPVVRLGDKFTVFDPGALRVFTDLALTTLPEKHQRRVMDGGTCEATAATAFGLPCIGISVPLGNYHNQNFEGGPDSRGTNGPAPEFVHMSDIQGLLTLCHSLLNPKLPWTTPWKKKLQEFKKEYRSYRPLLRSGP